MKKPKFTFYQRPNGRIEFLEFLETLPLKDQEKLLATISAIEEVGLIDAFRKEWCKKLDNDIYEIRSKVASNIQRALYFHEVDNQYIITHGFTKKTQKAPRQELEHARYLKQEFEEMEKTNHGNS